MKVALVKVNGIDYMAQHDDENVFISKQGIKDRDRMMIVELAYGEVRKVRVSQNKLKGTVINIKVQPNTQFNADVQSIVREYVPIMEGVVL